MSHWLRNKIDTKGIRRKPRSNSVLFNKSPLTKGLVEYFLADQFVSRKGVVYSPQTSGNVNVGTDDGEQCLLFNTSNAKLNLSQWIPDNSPITILMKFADNSGFASDKRYYISNSSSGIIIRSSNSTTLEFIINSLSGNDRVSHSVSYTAGDDVVIGGSWGGNGTYLRSISETIADGIIVTDDSATATGNYGNNASVINNAGGIIDKLKWFAGWNRQLTIDETKSFIRNPYQIIANRSLVHYLPVSTAASIAPQAMNHNIKLNNG